MNRWLGVAIVIGLLVLGFVGYTQPQLFPPGVDMAQLVYLIMALMLWTGAAYGFPRLRFEWRNALVSLMFWGGLIMLIVLIYPFFN